MKWHKNWLPPILFTYRPWPWQALIQFVWGLIKVLIIWLSHLKRYNCPSPFLSTKLNSIRLFLSQTPWNFKLDNREAVDLAFALFTVRYRHSVGGWLLIPRWVWLDWFYSPAPPAVSAVYIHRCQQYSVCGKFNPQNKLQRTWIKKKKGLLDTQVWVMMKWLAKGPTCDNSAICVWLWLIIRKFITIGL